MSLYLEHIIDPIKEGLSKADQGIPIPLPKLSRFTNYIEKGQNIVIGGRPTSGKSSFMDFIYFMNVFMWWRSLDRHERPPLKIFYFSMKSNSRIKLQKWLCLYLKLHNDITIDIPTITNGVGRLYDLNEEHKDAINEASEFFEELEEVLELVEGPQVPSDIFNRVRKYMDTIGVTDEKTGRYQLNNDHLGQITMTFTDNVDYLLKESNGYQVMNSDELKKKYFEYMEDLKNKYKITNVLVAPSRVSNSRMVRDSEPNYKELGIFNKADLGIVLYNAFNENNNKFLNYPIEELMVRGKNRFRTATIVRNANGLENITVGLIFLGECGYFRESPHPNERDLWDQFIRLLSELP